MKLFKSDIQAAAKLDFDSLLRAHVYHDDLARVARSGDEAEARAVLQSCYAPTPELRHLFACADRVTAELGKVSL